MSRAGVSRRIAFFAIGALLVASATGCEPLVNAPPGGGETVTQTFRYGPFTLGPGGEVMGTPSSGMPRPAGSFGLQGATFDVVDQNGTPVSVHDVHLHHIVMTTSAHQDALCPQRRERFIGAGMERTPIFLRFPYVYLVGAGDNWGSIYHLMNETQTTRTVYIQYTLRYQPGANATNSRPVQPWFMDVTGCGDSIYDVPGNGGPGSVYLSVTLVAGAARWDGGVRGRTPARRRHRHHARRHGAELADLHDDRHLPREPPPPREHQLLPYAREGDRRPLLSRHRSLRQLKAVCRRDGNRAGLRVVGHPIELTSPKEERAGRSEGRIGPLLSLTWPERGPSVALRAVSSGYVLLKS